MESDAAAVQLFQRRRWVDPGRLAEGLGAFVDQLAWIDVHTGLSMAGWRRTGPDGDPGAILATTTYDDHAWFLAEVARLQTLDDYAPVNDATATLTVGTEAFERWDAPDGLSVDWTLPPAGFVQVVGKFPVEPHPAWVNTEGADGLVTWFPSEAGESGGDDHRVEEWVRIH